jgi:hypothetical protein
MKLAVLALATLLVACAAPAPAPAPAPSKSGLAELMERGAERALIEGIRLYDEGQYPATGRRRTS